MSSTFSRWLGPSGRRRLGTVFGLLVSAGCGSATNSDAQFRTDIVDSMHRLLLADIQGLNKAAMDLQAAAPAGADRGWDPSNAADLGAIAAMKVAWDDARRYWERAESTLADSFPLLDDSMDSRYEDLLQTGGPDDNLFDGLQVTGMHAIERVLYVPGPAAVAAYEMTLAGYRPAAWPGTAADAAMFKSGLCQQLTDDTRALLDRWQATVIDLPTVFKGLTGLMDAQLEKVSLAVSHREESRYSQKTMSDLRWNLAGTKEIYALFTPWLATKDFGTTLDHAVRRAFDGLDATYGQIQGDAIPDPPSTWSPPVSAEDARSSFGVLYEAVRIGVDPSRPDSAVDALNHVARALGLPEFTGS